MERRSHYLLRRVESYNGLVILASNQRANIDAAFIRRLQSIIHFPIPRPEERYVIWKKTLPSQIAVADDMVIQQILRHAKRHHDDEHLSEDSECGCGECHEIP